MRNAYNGHLYGNGQLRYEYQHQKRVEYDDDEKHTEHDRIWISDHIIYCFDRKFSNHLVECSLLEMKLKSLYPYNIDTDWDDLNLREYRFLRTKNNQFYYLQIEPEDICPSGTECQCIECHRLHYISNEDMCDDKIGRDGCNETQCHKIHYVNGQRLSDRIISLLINISIKKVSVNSTLKRVSLIDFLRCYELKYGEFMEYYNITELKRVLNEYSRFKSYNIASDDDMRLWRITRDDYIEFEFVSIIKMLCLNHMESHCNFNPSYLCPWLHPDRFVFASLDNLHSNNNNNYTKQIYYPLLRSSKSIKSSLERKYKHINSVIVSNNNKYRMRPPHFLHFADQLIDCFDRNFSCSNWISLSKLKNKLQIGFPKTTSRSNWSKYRFLRYKMIGDCKYIGLNILADDLCPMGLHCSWFGCSRIHHISHEEIVYNSDDDDTTSLVLSKERFIDRMISILMCLRNDNNDNNDNKFWIHDLLIIYGKYYGSFSLNGSLFCSNDNSNNLSQFLNEYGKYYIVNDISGHTEYIQLWYCSNDEMVNKLYLKINGDVFCDKLCHNFVYSKCDYVPLSLCPYIHIDMRLIKDYNVLISDSLRIPSAQKYLPLSRSIVSIIEYIVSIKDNEDDADDDNDDDDDDFIIDDDASLKEMEAKWAQHLSSSFSKQSSLHRAFNYYRMEFSHNNEIVGFIKLIDELFKICVNSYKLCIVDISICGTSKNIVLKYEIIGSQTLFNLWQFFRSKSFYCEWCYNRIIVMKMNIIDSFVLFCFEGMNPFITCSMLRIWFESKYCIINNCNLKYASGTQSYLYKPSAFYSTSHALIFVFNNSTASNIKPAIHRERYFFSSCYIPYHIPKQNCYFADRILDCCSRSFNVGTSYGDLEYFMKSRYDSKDIFWHKYRFPQTDSSGYCFMNIQPDDICPFGDECKWLRCCRLHHISSQEICKSSRKCTSSSCTKLHLHNQRLVDRIASVLLYEYNNYINNKSLADSYIFLGKFLVIYQMLYDINFESLLYEMNLPKMKQQFPSRFADVAVFLIEYGRYPLINNTFCIKQLWNVSMYRDDHTPHITMNPVIVDLVCYHHMMSFCQYNPHYQCPFLHLDKKFVHCKTQCNDDECKKYHLEQDKLKKSSIQKYKPLCRSMNDIRESIENMRTKHIETADDEDKKHMIKWNKTLNKLIRSKFTADHRHNAINIEWKQQQTTNKSHIKFIHEIYKLAASNFKIQIIDIHINSTKKIISLMYRVISSKLWFELKKMLKNYDKNNVVWCFNRIIKLKINEMNLEDGLYIIFEFEPMNTLINIELTRKWFQHKIIHHFKFNYLLKTFMIYVDGVTQFIKLHSDNNKEYASLYCLNNIDEKKLLSIKETKIFKGKLPIKIFKGNDETNYPHRNRKFYHHSPPNTIEILLKKYQKHHKKKKLLPIKTSKKWQNNKNKTIKKKEAIKSINSVFGNWAYLKKSDPISLHELQHINDDINKNNSNNNDNDNHNDNDNDNDNVADEKYYDNNNDKNDKTTAYDFFFNH